MPHLRNRPKSQVPTPCSLVLIAKTSPPFFLSSCIMLLLLCDLETSGLKLTRHGILQACFALLDTDKLPVGPFDAPQSYDEMGIEIFDIPLLKPVTFDGSEPEFEPRALEVNGLSWTHCLKDGADPAEIFPRVHRWIEDYRARNTPASSEGQNPTRPSITFMSCNVGFDYPRVIRYLEHYNLPDPFFYCPLDIKTLFLQISKKWTRTRVCDMVKTFELNEEELSKTHQLSGRHTAKHDTILLIESLIEILKLHIQF